MSAPVIPVAKLIELPDSAPARYRALLLPATFANLHFGESAGLRRTQLDLHACEVRVIATPAIAAGTRQALRRRPEVQNQGSGHGLTHRAGSPKQAS
jgi:hypothetical protein